MEVTRRTFITTAVGAYGIGVHAQGRAQWRMPLRAFDLSNALEYARDWAGQRQNVCGAFFDETAFSDCAHFVAHCLAAGGLHINASEPLARRCPLGVTCRSWDLVDTLRLLSRTEPHRISEIDFASAVAGDVGFLLKDSRDPRDGFGAPYRPTHAFVISRAAASPLRGAADAVRVWAHSDQRSDEPLSGGWQQSFSTAFRLQSYTLGPEPPGKPGAPVFR
jgi:hypothetical protein